MATDATVERQRDIQDEVARADQHNEGGEKRPVQTGARDYPVPPFPEQHLPKPGEELYQISSDPFEIKNLATAPAQAGFEHFGDDRLGADL